LSPRGGGCFQANQIEVEDASLHVLLVSFLIQGVPVVTITIRRCGTCQRLPLAARMHPYLPTGTQEELNLSEHNE